MKIVESAPPLAIMESDEPPLASAQTLPSCSSKLAVHSPLRTSQSFNRPSAPPDKIYNIHDMSLVSVSGAIYEITAAFMYTAGDQRVLSICGEKIPNLIAVPLGCATYLSIDGLGM
jgi:hypothetical protein